MSLQKLHYENISGTLVQREGLLSWRCPLCKAGGQSLEVMRTCPECGSKEATLPVAQPAPSVPEGWKLVPVDPTLSMLTAAILSSHAINVHRAEHCYRAMIAVAPEAKP